MDHHDPDVVEDIEDLIRNEEDAPVVRLERPDEILARPRRAKASSELPDDASDPTIDSNIPGIQSIYVKTWGCAHNNSDGEYMAGQLAAYGYKVTDDEKQADSAQLWLLNSCTVKNPAQDHFVNTIRDARSKGKYVVLAGCVPQAAPKLPDLQGLSVIGVQQIDRVVEVVEETLRGHSVRALGMKKLAKTKLGGAALDLPKIRKNPLVEIIPINTGCLNQCTYCKTKHARGQLGSYPVEEIVARAKHVVFNEGVKEIWITSEDTGAYGRDIGTSLPELMWALLEVLPEPVMVRLGMTNPPYILEHLEEMAKIYRHPRMYSYLHCPIQSASDKVLDDMRREYTRSDFERIVDFLRERVEDITIATDLIVGFPTEDEEDFAQTVELVNKYQFNVLFINQFYPRPGTPAARMKRVATEIVKRRSREVSAIFKSSRPYDGRLGKVYEILVAEHAPDGVRFAGRNKSYEMILVEADPRIMGRMVTVKIIETDKWHMVGEITAECRAKLDAEMPPGAAEDQVQRWNDSKSKKVDLAKPQAALNAAKVWGDSCDDPHAGDPIDDEDDSCGTCGSHSEAACESDACGAENCDCKSSAESSSSTVAPPAAINPPRTSGSKKTYQNLPNFDGAASPVAISSPAASHQSPSVSSIAIFGAIVAILASLAILEIAS